MARELELVPELVRVDNEDQTHVLARHLAGVIARKLTEVRDPSKRLELANSLVAHLDTLEELVEEPVQELHALRPASSIGGTRSYPTRPRTPLSDAALLTNAHGEPAWLASFGPR